MRDLNTGSHRCWLAPWSWDSIIIRNVYLPALLTTAGCAMEGVDEGSEHRKPQMLVSTLELGLGERSAHFSISLARHFEASV